MDPCILCCFAVSSYRANKAGRGSAGLVSPRESLVVMLLTPTTQSLTVLRFASCCFPCFCCRQMMLASVMPPKQAGELKQKEF